MIAVGDPCQAIYSFRGADSESIQHIKDEFNAKELPLSVSYRCPKSVVAVAKQYVPYIEPSEQAPEGKVSVLDEWNSEVFLPTDGVICRNSAPLIDLAFRLLKHGRACKVLGRDIGQGLVRLIKKMDADTVEELEEKLATYQGRECQKLMAKGKEEQAAAIEDRVATIMIFCDQLEESHRTVDHLIERIERLFTDDPAGVLTLSTVHKAKGLEYDRVFILNPELMPSRYARQAWQVQAERNVIYVAVTRAKSELFYCSLKDWTERKEAVNA